MSEQVAMKHETIFEALFAIKSELGAVVKGLTNPFHKSKYADINMFLEVVEPVVQKHGCVLLQECLVAEMGGKPVNLVVTSITLASNNEQSVHSTLALPETNDIQKIGAGCTYARRFTLNSLLAMQAEDDDGNKASGRDKKNGGTPENPGEHILESGPEMLRDRVFRGAKVSNFDVKTLTWVIGKDLLNDFDANAVRAYLSTSLTGATS